jgi:L-lactate permease
VGDRARRHPNACRTGRRGHTQWRRIWFVSHQLDRLFVDSAVPIAVDTGKFEIIRDSLGALTDDRRLQLLLIAFSFSSFIEGSAGFGSPVAVSAAMRAGLGFPPFYAAAFCLVGNTAEVAFGSIGIPIITLTQVTGLPMPLLSAMTGRILCVIAVLVPIYLVVLMAGVKRRSQCGRQFSHAAWGSV